MEQDARGHRLDSWKEIADYLGRDLRTVMRWEEQRGLPVRRVPGGKRQSVFAFSQEIDLWLCREGRNGAGTEESEPVDAESSVAPPKSQSDSAQAVPAASTPLLRPWISTRGKLFLGLAAVLASGLVLGFYSMRRSPGVTTPYAGQGNFIRLNGNGTSLIFEPTALDPGTHPYELQVADFNNDGWPDIIFTSAPNDVVGIMLGKGDGAFLPTRVYENCEGAHWIARADFNRDGHEDVAVSCLDAHKILVLWGKGDGTFPSRAEISMEGSPRFLSVGDLDRDGWPDLVASDFHKGDLYLVKNDGGRFRSAVLTHVEMFWVPAVLDWDGDGKLDVVGGVRAQGKTGLGFLRGRGDGTFEPLRIVSETADLPGHPLVADFDKDGRPDLVFTTWGQDVLFLHRLSNGTFAPPQPIPGRLGMWTISAADLDGDGNLDILASSSSRGTLLFFRGRGDSTFFPVVEVPIAKYPAFPTVADFNGDGRPDVMFSLTFEDTFLMLRSVPNTPAQK